MPVDRGKAHVRYFIELFQLLHDEGADLGRGDLLLRPLLQRRLHAVGDSLQGRDADRPFLTRLQQSSDELLTIEALARPVLRDEHVRELVDAFVTGEPLRAAQTLTAAADDFALFALAGVDHLIAKVAAV